MKRTGKRWCSAGGRMILAGVALMFLAGCAASQTMISKRNLDVQTKMSETIFLDPIGPEQKTIYVEVRNTSDKDNFDLEGPIKAAMTKRGYRVTQDPKEAHYRLQANVLQVGKTDGMTAQAALHAGYGGEVTVGKLVGERVGAAAGGWTGADAGGLAGSVVGGATELLAGSLVKDVYFSVITDIQLVEKAADGVDVRQDSQQHLVQGMGGAQQQTSSEITKFKKYRTRVVSTANKVNLDYEEAAQALTQGLTRALSGLF